MELKVKNTFVAAVFMAVSASPAWAVGTIADVTIYDRTQNRTLPLHYHEGRYYVAGQPGHEYEVRIRNNQAGEILSVVSIDGVNAISGETADWSQTGYILNPHTSFGIKGWRKNLQRVAAFFFTELDNSYAARTGRPDNVGVIGVAVFRKKHEVGALIGDYLARNRPPAREAEARTEAGNSAKDSVSQAEAGDAAAPRASTVVPQPAPESKKLGTGHGQNQTSVVRYGSFERASTSPDEVITIFYDSYPNLVAQGVIRATMRLARPNAFPQQFVPDPR
jgi:hypothetical protein